MNASDNATTWRDLANQLTPTQVGLLERAEQLEGAEQRTAMTPSDLLDWALDCIEANGEQAVLDARLAHIEIPAGATTGGWDSIRYSGGPGDATRSLEWSSFDTPKAYVSIEGIQDESGAVTRGVRIHARHGELDELSVPDVHELIHALHIAAGALAELERRP